MFGGSKGALGFNKEEFMGVFLGDEKISIELTP
jgi:hypothetical protein